jgi:hypothetical protein
MQINLHWKCLYISVENFVGSKSQKLRGQPDHLSMVRPNSQPFFDILRKMSMACNVEKLNAAKVICSTSIKFFVCLHGD